ncbi:hypothetical protein EIN_279700 [Entamoeba invadens IP1]|uniref:Uncharacterized protein n=1 Tax=Entamoeba invadens IP1 TaxID=370355 RepID=A0A0A1U7V9_ENTIV|nr:hypothetical protein EIN_279700 [Entamoeba invadens IP1]ELP90983.1 hypothetical protein EIN_279700 [Entamoeba invadens IP1]|eukprot:XP_004257754.1 hypothetical protein EIN_279700 [Entamoeba invadens IP1]
MEHHHIAHPFKEVYLPTEITCLTSMDYLSNISSKSDTTKNLLKMPQNPKLSKSENPSKNVKHKKRYSQKFKEDRQCEKTGKKISLRKSSTIVCTSLISHHNEDFSETEIDDNDITKTSRDLQISKINKSTVNTHKNQIQKTMTKTNENIEISKNVKNDTSLQNEEKRVFFLSDKMGMVYSKIKRNEINTGIAKYFETQKTTGWSSIDLKLFKVVGQNGIIGVEELITDDEIKYFFFTHKIIDENAIRWSLYERVEFFRSVIDSMLW